MSKAEHDRIIARYNTPIAESTRTKIARSTLLELIPHGLPHVLVRVSPSGRRLIRFIPAQVDGWLQGRRERQVGATLTGDRYTREDRK